MSTTPLKTQLPRTIDPRKFAQKGIELEGFVPVSELSRVAKLVSNTEAEVSVKLKFDVEEQRFRVIQGSVEGVLKVPCQRCLDSLDFELSADMNLAIVWDEEGAKKLPKRFDSLILEEGPTDIYTVVEDEILLSVPMVSYHDHACIDKTSFGEDATTEDGQSQKKNPFQILEQLKGSPKS